jgi:hypothetical protein
MLPWLALTAQLPFAAGKPKANLLSWFLAIGSPALVTFSLVITIANRHHVRHRFLRLKNKPCDRDRLTRLQAAEYLLSGCQQVPLHVANQEWLLALIQLLDNKEWWKTLLKTLKETRRKVTAAFVAQYALAVLAWVFTLSVAFVSLMDDSGSATDLSCSNLWVWLVSYLNLYVFKTVLGIC